MARTLHDVDLYNLACRRLIEVMDRAKPDDIVGGFASMGPSDFLGDLTNGQLAGALAVLDWIMDFVQYSRGIQGLEKRQTARDS